MRKSILFLLLLPCLPLLAQNAKKVAGEQQVKSIVENNKNFDGELREENEYRVMFYNVENLFHPDDDSLTNDNEFTPEGTYHWTTGRYIDKLNSIYKVFMAVGGYEPPDFVGVCEIENRQVLQELVWKTPLKKFGYEVVHVNSPDQRGIDVGFFYRKEKFKYLSHDSIRVKFPQDSFVLTRDILHVYGLLLPSKQPVHFFVNHWPSRRGGAAESEPKRVYVASLLKKRCNEIYREDPKANIIIMGDFNDEPFDRSIKETLGAKSNQNELQQGDFYNCMGPMKSNWKLGSHKFREHWGVLDQIILSEPLFTRKRGGLIVKGGKANIYTGDFLLKEDETNFGMKPSRMYEGQSYKGGFSDHLPIYIDLVVD